MAVRVNRAKIYLLLLIYIICFGSLVGCAASDASRSAACSIDNAYLGVTSSCSEMDITESYQNTSQKTKGLLIGGVTGGVIGGLTNGVGVVPGTVTGAILGGALGAYIDAHTTLVDQLENRGVKIFVLGDHVMIVLPSIQIFNEMTPHIKYASYSTLDLVARLICCFMNISVQISAYTNETCFPQADFALTQQQANNIARYLWKRGINTRLLYSMGYGGLHPVSPKGSNWICNENYRVEITLEKLPCCL